MQARDVFTCAMGARKFGQNFIKAHCRSIDDPGTFRAKGQKSLRHERASIKANRRTGDEVAPAQGDKIRGTGPRAYEMDRHGVPLPAIAGASRNRRNKTAPPPKESATVWRFRCTITVLCVPLSSGGPSFPGTI